MQDLSSRVQHPVYSQVFSPDRPLATFADDEPEDAELSFPRTDADPGDGTAEHIPHPNSQAMHARPL